MAVTPKSESLESHDERESSVEPANLSHLAVESLPSGVLILDASGTVLFANSAVGRQFGYEAGQLVGQAVETLLPERLRGAHARHRAAITAHPHSPETSASQQLTGLRRDGSEFPIEIALQPVLTGPDLRLLAVVSEATGLPQAPAREPLPVGDEVAFDRLIAEKATQFINLPSDQVDDAILALLRDVVLALGLDRAAVIQLEEGGALSYPVRWTRPGLPDGPKRMDAREAYPWSLERLLRGEMVCFSTLAEVHHASDRASYGQFGIKAAVILPLGVGGQIAGLANFACMRVERHWTEDVVAHLRLVASVLGTVLLRRRSDGALRAALDEVARLRDRLQEDNRYLRSEVRERLGHTRVVGLSPAMQAVLDQARQVAATDASVLLIGETGTGKELLAEQIHEMSTRRARPMVRVNCAALPATLLESELFGRERGAYTGASTTQAGRFELADGSSFFLDEIGDLPLDAQVKLLRVLEQKQIERLGSSRTIRVDTRIIAATHRDLEKLVAEEAFREDLYYRLNVFPIRVPPLRERVQDIPPLVWHFVEDFSVSLRKQVTAIPKDSMEALQRYSWPGNVRELRNVIERAMIVAIGPELTIPVPLPPSTAQKSGVRLNEVEREHIRRVLDATRWRIRGPGGAAEQLGMKPTTLETRMAKLGLSRSSSRP